MTNDANEQPVLPTNDQPTVNESVQGQPRQVEVSEDPRSTWGASEKYKAAWHEQYGNRDDDGNVTYAGSAPDDVRQGTTAQAAPGVQVDQTVPGAGPGSVGTGDAGPVATDAAAVATDAATAASGPAGGKRAR